MTASSRLNWAERQSKVAGGLDESVNMGREYEIGFEVFGKFCYGVYGGYIVGLLAWQTTGSTWMCPMR